MRHRFMRMLIATTALASGLVFFPAAAGAATAVTSPQGALTAVSALSAHEAWAVGCKPSTIAGECPASGVDAAYRWNGSAWKNLAVPMPVPANPAATQYGELTGVKVISASDAWAVGNASATGAQIVHWNGHAWKQVAVPALPAPWGTGYTLNAVAATSPSNVWAVGAAGGATVMLRYNGTTWKRVRSPSFGTVYIYGVAVTSPTNAWAVGTDGSTKALILHWNGASWKVAMNAFASFDTALSAVATSSSTNVWAGGVDHAYIDSTLTVRGKGTAWSRITKGQAPNSATWVYGLATTSASNVWAVGSIPRPILHWNGARWTTVSPPKFPGFGLTSLNGVVATSVKNAWAVGSYQDASGVPHIVIVRWNGTSWSRVA